jgi:hypothetical protein
MEVIVIVKEQKKIYFNNRCNCIVDNDLLEKAILWYSKSPTTANKKIFMYGRYPAVSIYYEKIHIHRLLYIFTIKNLIPNGYVVHHIDENRLNASISNLELITHSQHSSLHNGRKIFNKENCKISYSSLPRQRGIAKDNITYKQIWDLYREGYSINKISKELNYGWHQVNKRLKEIFNKKFEEVESEY